MVNSHEIMELGRDYYALDDKGLTERAVAGQYLLLKGEIFLKDIKLGEDVDTSKTCNAGTFFNGLKNGLECATASYDRMARDSKWSNNYCEESDKNVGWKNYVLLAEIIVDDRSGKNTLGDLLSSHFSTARQFVIIDYLNEFASGLGWEGAWYRKISVHSYSDVDKFVDDFADHSKPYSRQGRKSDIQARIGGVVIKEYDPRKGGQQ